MSSLKSVPRLRSNKRRWLWWAGVVLLAGAVAPAFSPKLYAPYQYSSRYLTMRDGVKIAVDLYLPKDMKPEEKISAVMNQTRYYRSNRLHQPFDWFWSDINEKWVRGFTSHRYAYVVVDVRGAGASFGSRTQEWSPDEIRDGAQIVDWIAQQPWSNQKVGSFGGSYDGVAAQFLAANKHPAVKAIVPMSSAFDAYADMAYPGGVHFNRFIHLWSDVTQAMDHDEFRDKYLHGFAHFAYKGVRPVQGDANESMLHAATEEHKKNYNLWASLQGKRFHDDGRYVEDTSPYSRATDIKDSGVAIFELSGWYDGALAHAAIKRYLTIQNPADRMILGPWDHQRQDLSPFPGPNSRMDLLAEFLRFFDQHLNNINKATAGEKPIRYYTVAENKWKYADTWPPPASNIAYYLGADRLLNTQAPAAGSGKDVYQVDFSAATGNRTRWNSLLVLDKAPGPYQLRDGTGKKLLTYASAPLGEDTEVTGHPLVDLFVETNASDGNFFVYLEDVDEQQHVHYVTEGVLRGMHRKVSQEPPLYNDVAPYHTYKKQDATPLVAGQITELRFDLQPISYLFKKGHSIRVAFAGADRDHFESQPTDASTVTYYREPTRASRIVLPVVERNRKAE